MEAGERANVQIGRQLADASSVLLQGMIAAAEETSISLHASSVMQIVKR